MITLLLERPIPLAADPLPIEEEAEEMEDFVYHQPVLAREVVTLLAPKSGSLIVDATCGGGGHTEALLEGGANVVALDQDPDELGIGAINGALLDLGVSSRQLENAERGFSLLRNGPLDMRMDPRNPLTAATIVNEYSAEQLTRLFREFGEEPAARRIASLIVKMRKTSPFRETLPLARAIEKAVGRHGRRHPATQVFQALRMEVNDELGALEEGLRVLTARLQTGGRVAVISFHSLEERMVKSFFRDHSQEWLDRPEWPEPQRNPDYDLKLITAKPVEPAPEEQRANPRSRSAKLRVAGKI